MSIFNSHQPNGAIKTNEKCTFTVRLEKQLHINGVYLLICYWEDWENNRYHEMLYESETDSESVYTVDIQLDEANVYGYCFYIRSTSIGTKLIKKNPETNEAFISNNKEGEHWKLTIYDEGFKTPDFAKKGVMYQIFLDRYSRSDKPKEEIPEGIILREDWEGMPIYEPDERGIVRNNDFFGGDFKGMEKQLPFMKKMGVTVLYFMPIVESMENHGYSTANFIKVNPLLGNWDDFESFCSKAHSMGMHTILDAVFSHTGSDSIYFNKEGRYDSVGAYNSQESPYYSWYSFRDYPNVYESWWGINTLPQLNKFNKNYQEYIYGNEDSVIDLWLKKGADGIRLDVADELPDEFIDGLVAKINSQYENKVIYGEVWEDAITKTGYGKRRKYLLGNQLSSVMNYPFRNAIINYIKNGGFKEFYNTIISIVESYPKPALNCAMNFLSTHDTVRAINEFSGMPIPNFEGNWIESRRWQAMNDKLQGNLYRSARRKFMLATMIQFFLPGIPCVFYGDEVGLYGYSDPFNRKTYPWNRMDKKLLKFFRILGKIRKKYDFVSEADFRFIEVNEEICSFERYNEKYSLLISISRTETQTYIPREYVEGRNLKVLYELKNNSMVIGTIIIKDRP